MRISKKRESTGFSLCFEVKSACVCRDYFIHLGIIFYYNTYCADLVNIKSCLRCVANNKDDDYGSQHGGHCGVTAVSIAGHEAGMESTGAGYGVKY